MTAQRRPVQPVTDAERDQIRQLHAEGLPLNEIARRLGRSASTVGRAARGLGLSFDRSRTIAATAAAVADARSRRAALAITLLEDAERLRAQLWQPHTYIDHGGKDFVRQTWEQDEPTPSDKRQLMLAAGGAIDRSLKLDLHDHDGGAGEGRSLIGALASGLRVAYDQLGAEDSTTDDRPTDD